MGRTKRTGKAKGGTSGGGGGVTSFNGRVGVVTPQLADYSTLFQNAGIGLVPFRQTISALQAATLNSVPIDIADLPAAGVGYAWEIISYTVKYVVGATEYDFGLIYLLAETALAYQADYDYGSVIGGAGTIISRGDITGASVSGNKSTVIENKKMQIQSDADPTTGDGTFVVYGTARKITI